MGEDKDVNGMHPNYSGVEKLGYLSVKITIFMEKLLNIGNIFIK